MATASAPTTPSEPTAPSPETSAPPPAEPEARPSGDSPNAPPPPSDQAAQASAQAQQSQQAQQQQGPTIKRDPVPFEPQNVDDMYRYARMLAGASLLPRAYYDRDDKDRKHPRISDVHFVLLKGQALGLHPTVSIATINIIDGKAEIGASLMVALCLKSGLCEYFDLVHSDERSATFATKRRGGRREIEFTYTIEEADQMGLLDKGKSDWAKENNQWKKQPRTMLRRRAQSMLAREVYPDIVMGLYDHDEIGEMRERERALGIDPDRVIPMNGIETPPAADAPPEMAALPPPGERADFRKRIPETYREEREREDTREPVPARKADPLKERLKSRGREREAQVPLIDPSGAPILGPGEVPCAVCQVPIEGRRGDRCIACKDS